MADERKEDHLYSTSRPPDAKRMIIIQPPHIEESHRGVPPAHGGILRTSPVPPFHEQRHSSPTPPPAHRHVASLSGGKPVAMQRQVVRVVQMPGQNLMVPSPGRPSSRNNPSPVAHSQLSRPSSRGSPAVAHANAPTSRVSPSPNALQLPHGAVPSTSTHGSHSQQNLQVSMSQLHAVLTMGRPSPRGSPSPGPITQSQTQAVPLNLVRPSSRPSSRDPERPPSRESPRPSSRMSNQQARMSLPVPVAMPHPVPQLAQVLGHPVGGIPMQSELSLAVSQAMALAQAGVNIRGLHIPNKPGHAGVPVEAATRIPQPRLAPQSSVPQRFFAQGPSPPPSSISPVLSSAVKSEPSDNGPTVPRLPIPTLQHIPTPDSASAAQALTQLLRMHGPQVASELTASSGEPEKVNLGSSSGLLLPNSLMPGMVPPPLHPAPHVLITEPSPSEVDHVGNGGAPAASVPQTLPSASPGMPKLQPEGALLERDCPAARADRVVPKKEAEPEAVRWEHPFNMRVANLNHFPASQTTYRATYRSHAVAIHRAKAGSITGAAKSLDLLRQNLQKYLNREIDVIIQKYLEKFFMPGVENIKLNNGENNWSDEHVQAVCRQILEEAKKMYTPDVRCPTPDNSDNTSESGSLVENRAIRASKISLFNIKRGRRGSSDSDVSIPRKKKKGRPPAYIQGASGRSTPSKTGKSAEPVKREGPKWNPERLKPNSQFVMGARANKALGLGATRGRLYVKHPEVYKYAGDQDDKQWLHDNHHMPATGGKAYMLLVEDIKELTQTDEYRSSPLLQLEEIIGFTVPDWMLEKMKAQMRALRTDMPKPVKFRSRSGTPNVINQTHNGAEDVDGETESGMEPPLPFSSLACPDKGSPSNTENMDLLSTDPDEEGHTISPFNMSAAFNDGSPAPDVSPAPSDLENMDDDAPLSAPFMLH